jgi:perosamine synthetase
MSKGIFTSFSPNVGLSDYLRILGYLFLPWQWAHWKTGTAQKQFAQAVEQDFGKAPIFFDSGRTALYFALKTCGVKAGDEVAVQAFTCVVVVNAIRALGATPLYIDILQARLVMDPEDLKKKCTSRTKAVILQHTFGVPAPIEAIAEIAKEKGMAMVEDCAHTIGGTYRGKLLGTFGDVGIFSFGTDKVMSTMRGGMAIAQTKEKEEQLRTYEEALPFPTYKTLLQRLLHPLIFALALPLYHKKGIGKALLYGAKKLHLFAHIMTPREKEGLGDGYRKERFANVLADLGLHQWKKLKKRNAQRTENAHHYLTWCKKHADSCARRIGRGGSGTVTGDGISPKP